MKLGCSRNRQNGGGAGQSYGFGGSVDPSNPSLGNAARVIPFSSCGGADRPGFDTSAQIKGGLPGFAGGGRRRGRGKGKGKNRKTQKRKQRGGVYSLTGAELVNGIAYSQRAYTGCGEGQYATPNSLNPPGSQTPLTAPPPTQSGGVGGVDSMAYSAPRAGYAILPGGGSTIYDGVTGYEGRIGYSGQPYVSGACLKTGGRRKSRNNRSKKNRKRTNRKRTNRKSKSNRKN